MSTFLIRPKIGREPRKIAQAQAFYASRPTLLGRPLTVNTVVEVSEEELLDLYRSVLEPLANDGIIEIRKRSGELFSYAKEAPIDLLAEAEVVEEPDELPTFEVQEKADDEPKPADEPEATQETKPEVELADKAEEKPTAKSDGKPGPKSKSVGKTSAPKVQHLETAKDQRDFLDSLASKPKAKKPQPSKTKGSKSK